jgi:predicted negative regulator of RcsB-dependent stress response
MLARIEDSPKRAIRTDYAEAWLRYGNRVSADYSFNFVPSRSSFAVVAESSGTPLVHYSIEIDPQNFTMETDEKQSKFYTTLDVTVEVRTLEGTLIVANDKEVYLELSPSQMQTIRSSPFAYQDDFPLVPGDYNVSIILRNRVISQYTVAEKEISIPAPSATEPKLIDLVLAFESKSSMSEIADGEVRTFQVGNMRFQPAADNVFVIGDTVHVVTQAFGATAGHRVVFELASGDQVIKSIESPVGDHGMIFDHLALEDMVGGNYEVRARLLSPEGAELSKRSTPITVSPRSVATRPGFIYRRGFNTRFPGLIQLVRAEQLWNLGRLEEAKADFEKAVALSGENLPEAKWKLANAYIVEKRADDALQLLRPLEASFPNQFEVASGLGYALYIKGQCQEAVGYLDRARQIRPPDKLLLNTSGDCHQKLGHAEQAREAFERSLELDAEQPEVKERLEMLGAPAKTKS